MHGKSEDVQTVTRPLQVAPEKPTRYAWYVAVILMLVQVISFLDRKALVILAEPIKHALKLSDTQLGLLTGAVFTVVYGFSSFPLARIADRFSRSKVIGVCLLVWSGLTAMGGFATSFWFLAASRMGVAIGEAGSQPAGHSLVANYFPPRARGRALALVAAGSPIGIMAGLSVAGVLNDLFNWRIALFAVGMPGILVAVLVFLTVREVERPAIAQADRKRYSLASTTRQLFSDTVLRNLLLGTGMHFVAAGAVNAFMAAFIMRRFGLSATATGLSFGLMIGVTGVVGHMTGGWMTDRLAPRNPGAPLLLLSAGVLACVATMYFMVSMPVYPVMLGLIACQAFLASLYAGPSFSTLQGRIDDGQRATATAIMFFMMNGIGTSAGPLIVGMVSDSLAVNGATNWHTLRVGLLATIPFELVAALLYFRAGRALRAGARPA
jgi:MFS transporter, Spinster family, sphingosine-1-phosphate transporter